MQKRIRTRNNGGRKDITLMTLLANESTSDSRKLLKKYDKPDATNTADLEVKLAELYYSVPDKIALEKELCEIHPHRNWILKHSAKLEEAKKDIENIQKGDDKIISNGAEPTSNYCGCSHFDGVMSKQEPKMQLTMNDYAGLIGLVAVIGLTFYIVTKK